MSVPDIGFPKQSISWNPGTYANELIFDSVLDPSPGLASRQPTSHFHGNPSAG
jgi:hypothetical protein